MKPLELVRAKANRAEQHINDLEVIVQNFLDSYPYEVSLNYNSHTRENEWYLTRTTDIPIAISVIAGDALQNLRSTLDHLVWQLTLVNNQPPRPGVTGFPITETAQEYSTTKIRRKIEGVGQIAAAAIDALKPYSGGNDPLWRLHCLNNIDKHRLIFVCSFGDESPSFAAQPKTGNHPDIFRELSQCNRPA